MKPFERQSIFMEELEEAYVSIPEENSQTIGSMNSTPTEKSREVSNVAQSDIESKYQKLLIENSKLTNDNKVLKKLLTESKSIILQKEIKIKKLLAQKHHANTLNLFEQYEKYFSSSDIKKLRSIRKGNRADSTFVTQCLDYLYGGKQNLLDRVATNIKVPAGKKPISPEKVDIVSHMLLERLNSEGLYDELSTVRFNRLRKLLNNAICTARKTVPVQHSMKQQPAENHTPNALPPKTEPSQPLQHLSSMQSVNSLPFQAITPIQQFQPMSTIQLTQAIAPQQALQPQQP